MCFQIHSCFNNLFDLNCWKFQMFCSPYENMISITITDTLGRAVDNWTGNRLLYIQVIRNTIGSQRKVYIEKT